MISPKHRRLRCYSFDPSLASDVAHWVINEIEIEVPWECNAEGASILGPGPIGEYIEVVDHDPASGLFYVPIDLDEPRLLAQNGLPASENNPQFHQQMVYAVAMATIDHFEKACGRKALWSARRVPEAELQVTGVFEQFVRRLRIYPHALRARNAYYSPARKALLFGYFPVAAKDEKNTPGTTVFTCLSHDIIVHEMSHALLDGVHPRYNEPTNPDVHALHEAFADIVAIFQRFSYAGVLENQISHTRGDLAGENMLAQLAQQFGRATGRGTALRDALGSIDTETGAWLATPPNPRALEGEYEPHARGAILVAAVFRAFTLVYNHRVADLFRLSTGGTGVLPDGAIHPDLVHRLASEAREVAARILRMCMRGLDYCPPVDVTFGDYLRAVITADLDITVNDRDRCRVAFVQAFREWGIAPAGIRSMSVESLVWNDFATAGAMARMGLGSGRTAPATPTAGVDRSRLRVEQSRSTQILRGRVRGLRDGYEHSRDDEDLGEAPPESGAAGSARRRRRRRVRPVDLRGDRFEIWQTLQDNGYPIWRWLNEEDGGEVAESLNLVIDDARAPRTVYRNARGHPTVEVHAIRPILRREDHLGERAWLVVEVTQRRRGYFDIQRQEEMDGLGPQLLGSERGDFTYRAGCTFFLDPETFDIGWVIPTAGTIASDVELERMRRHFSGEGQIPTNDFDAGMARGLAARDASRDEPFALLHDHEEG